MSTRVEEVLEQIAGFSPEEQQELLQALPGVMRENPQRGRLTLEAVERAIANRERIRARLLAEGRPLGSINDDLEALREERLDELMGFVPAADAPRHDKQ